MGQDKDTKYTLFAPKKYPDIQNLPQLSISGQTVPYTTVIKYLGVYLDHKLTFKDHIEKLNEKIKNTLVYFIMCDTSYHQNVVEFYISHLSSAIFTTALKYMVMPQTLI